MNIQDLNTFYQDAEGADSDVFAEMRSNVLLVAGNHYSKKMQDFLDRSCKSNVDKQQKLRLVRNHIQKISSIYRNNILSQAPSVGIKAHNEGELQDVKFAEQSQSVWTDWRDATDWKEKLSQAAQDFVDIGECIVKLYFDPNAGKFLGFEPILDEQGLPVLGDDEKPKTRSIFEGEVVAERILPFNFLRDQNAKSWDEVKRCCIRKMVDVKDLKAMVAGDPDKEKMIQESSKNTYQVFDGNSSAYTTTKDQCMVREYYFKPCLQYPEGYFYITVEDGILFEGELPHGIWPFEVCAFDTFPTHCRGFSKIKQLRPYQAEINRCASSIALTQMTLGFDKLVLKNGTSMEPGGEAHGVRSIKVNGQDPTVIAGRSGDQFLGYLNANISEMYAVASIAEDSEEKVPGQTDPYAVLFRTMREKKKYAVYAEKFSRFQVRVCKKIIQLCQKYYPDEKVIPVLGRSEIVNLPEWKSNEDLRFRIVCEEVSEDFETKMGRQLSLNHILQYAGSNLQQSDLGKLIRIMPYVNDEQQFSDLTIDYDNATNDILRLDRGEYPATRPQENPVYLARRITHRMKQADFDFLPDLVKQLYLKKSQELSQVVAMNTQKEQALKDGYIPTGGYLVACDFYIADPANPDKMPKRARVPYESMIWLMDRLNAQGMSQQNLSQLGQSGIAAVSDQMSHGQQPPQGQVVSQGASSPTPMQMAGLRAAMSSPSPSANVQVGVTAGAGQARPSSFPVIEKKGV